MSHLETDWLKVWRQVSRSIKIEQSVRKRGKITATNQSKRWCEFSRAISKLGHAKWLQSWATYHTFSVRVMVFSVEYPLALFDLEVDWRTFLRHAVILFADSSNSAEKGSSMSPRAYLSNSVVVSVNFIVSFLKKSKVKSIVELSGPPSRSFSRFPRHEATNSTLLPPEWDAGPLQGYPLAFDQASLTICRCSFYSLASP